MVRESTGSIGLQLSLTQAMKLVVFWAAAFVCVAPIVRLWALGGPTGGGVGVVIFSVICVPLVWASLSFLLVRRGEWRDRVILGQLLCSVSAALAMATWGLYAIARNMILRSPPSQEMIRDLLLVAAVVIVLAVSATFLTSRLVRKFRGQGTRSRAHVTHQAERLG